MCGRTISCGLSRIDWSWNGWCPLTIGCAACRTTSRSVVRLLVTCPDVSNDFATDSTNNRAICRRCDDSLCDPSPYATIDRTIGHTTLRLTVRSVVGRNNWSVLATTSRTTTYDWYCHQSTQIVGDPATTRTTNRQRPIAACDRYWRSWQTLPIGRTLAKSQPIVRSRNRTIRCDCGLNTEHKLQYQPDINWNNKYVYYHNSAISRSFA